MAHHPASPYPRCFYVETCDLRPGGSVGGSARSLPLERERINVDFSPGNGTVSFYHYHERLHSNHLHF